MGRKIRESAFFNLYGGKDNLQSLAVIKTFADKYNCGLTIAENSEHSFMGEEDGFLVDKWLRDYI